MIQERQVTWIWRVLIFGGIAVVLLGSFALHDNLITAPGAPIVGAIGFGRGSWLGRAHGRRVLV